MRDERNSQRSIRLWVALFFVIGVQLSGACAQETPVPFEGATTRTESTADATPGTLINYGHTLSVRGTEVVQVIRAELTDVSPKLKVQRLWAFNPEQAKTPGIGIARGDLFKLMPEGVKGYPVRKMRFNPNSEENRHWQLIVTVSSDVPGTYRIPGLRLEYEVAGRKSEHTFRYAMVANVIDCDAEEAKDQVVCDGAPDPNPFERDPPQQPQAA